MNWFLAGVAAFVLGLAVSALASALFPARVPKDDEDAEAQPPVAGEQWFLTDGSPWPKLPKVPATILDARDGWVRYRLGRVGGAYDDQRMELEMFLRIYKKFERQDADTEPARSDEQFPSS